MIQYKSFQKNVSRKHRKDTFLYRWNETSIRSSIEGTRNEDPMQHWFDKREQALRHADCCFSAKLSLKNAEADCRDICRAERLTETKAILPLGW